MLTVRHQSTLTGLSFGTIDNRRQVEVSGADRVIRAENETADPIVRSDADGDQTHRCYASL